MSAHERERLSGYLDGELAAAERAEVEAHLQACPECAALLADMEVLDGEARRQPVEVPEGYFATFPARVRSRIEGGGSRRAPAPGPRRLPRWTWAAAAALILGVLTPLTLREITTQDAPATPPALFAPEPDSSFPAPEAPAALEDRGAPRSEAAARPLEADRERRAEEDEEKVLARAQEAAQERPPAFAAAPRVAAPPAAAPPPTPDPAEGLAAGAASSEGRAAALRKDARPSGPGRPGAEVESQALEERPALESGEAGFAAEPVVGSAMAPSVEAEETLESSPVGATAAGERRRLFPPDVRLEIEATRAFDELARQDLAPADEAETWRQRREAWRRYARDYPRSRHADEARVRVIEAGLEAWRAGGASEDLARARQDAAAYLARDDAALASRVERALDGVPE